MAIAVTQTGAINTDADDDTIELAGCVLTIGLIYIAFILTSEAAAPNVSSIAGTGLSMTKRTTTGTSEGDIDDSGGVLYRVECWYGKCTASGTVTITATLDSVALNSDFMLYEVTGCKTSGTNGSDAIVQAECLTNGATTFTALTIVLGAFGSSNNRPLGFCMHCRNEDTDHGAGFTELLDANHSDPSLGISVQWHSSSAETELPWTWATETATGGIGIELAAEVASGAASLSGDGKLTHSSLLGGLAR